MEWYIRLAVCEAIVVHVSLTGSKSSEANTGPTYVASAPPPTARTVPSASITALPQRRPKAIEPVACHVGDAVGRVEDPSAGEARRPPRRPGSS